MGFPVTADLLRVPCKHIGPGIGVSNLLSTLQPWPVSEGHTETERKCGPAQLKATLYPWVCKKIMTARQRHFKATLKVEQLFFHRGWDARSVNYIHTDDFVLLL